MNNRLAGLQKLTLLDYPNKTACTVFYSGCNLRCPFCHNKELVVDAITDQSIEQELFSLLAKRKGILDGVCITGGEPLLSDHPFDLIKRIKEQGFLVKLDTNGFYPDRLKYLLDNKLIDYVAVDIKNSPQLYAQTVGVKNIDLQPLKRTIELLQTSGIEYEFRTTVVKPLHTKESLNQLAQWIAGTKHYYLQQFINSGNLINDTNLSAYTDQQMQELLQTVRKHIPNAQIRGV